MFKVRVLISTYNGEKYISNLLDSVLAQKDVEVSILVRDDGSTDRTVSILQKYRKESKIDYYVGLNKGYALSFWELISKSNSYDYFAFCDQDDIWLPQKLSSALKILQMQNINIPLLYTSNVIPVGNDLIPLKHKSFNCKGVISIYESFQKSILPGCTFVMNNLAIKLLQRYNGFMESHDWATYIIVNCFGKVVYDKNSYIYYRIHEENTIGLNNRLQVFMNQFKRFFKKSPQTRSRFARDFLRCYGENIPNDFRESIYNLAYYQKNIKSKIKLLIDRNYKGFIFKAYVLLNRV